jgi:hypothetical protein
MAVDQGGCPGECEFAVHRLHIRLNTTGLIEAITRLEGKPKQPLLPKVGNDAVLSNVCHSRPWQFSQQGFWPAGLAAIHPQ